VAADMELASYKINHTKLCTNKTEFYEKREGG
jgi:hypothetical protein